MDPTSVPWSTMMYGLLGLALLWQVHRLLVRLWWQPRRLERALRAQGIRGTSYRFLTGDVKDYGRLSKEAWARPLPLRCHDIAPRVAPFVHRTITEHGKTCLSWFGPIPKVTIADAEVAKDVLSNKMGHFEKLKFPVLSKLLADGVANYEGEKWAKHRRILNPAFHLEKLKRMLPAFAACCTELVDKWEGLAKGGGESYEVDVWPEMQSLTGDVISRAAFGSSYLEGQRIFQLQGEQIELLVTTMNKIHIPGYIHLPTKSNRRMKQIAAEIEGMLKRIIAKRESALKAGEASSDDDLLGLLLESNLDHSKGNGGTASSGISIDDVIGECKLFYFAGMETTSVLLTWTMVVLSMHPEWQDRAREEVLHVFGSRAPDYDGLSRLRIVTMVLYEVLRLYTPLTALQRKTYKPMELGGVRYPAGVVLTLPLLCVHHDKDVWGADADEFRPERFAEGISKASREAPAFFPFGWGPRICIGQNFALLEAKMGLSMILQRFSFDLSPSYTHAPFPVGLLQPEHGAQVRLTRLN